MPCVHCGSRWQLPLSNLPARPPSPSSYRRAADYVKESGLPSFLNERTLEVETPSGKQTIPNPFRGYSIDR